MNQFIILFVIALYGGSCSNAAGLDRILGGTPATQNQFPYAASLQLIAPQQNYFRGHRCGGALITHQHVLTAASCLHDNNNVINPSNYRVFAGAEALTNINDDRIRLVANFTLHPNYSTSRRYENDIAIVTLVEPFANNTVTPVELLVTEPGPGNITVQCTTAGWGAQNATSDASTQLMYAQKIVMEQIACQLLISMVDSPLNEISSTMVCTTPLQAPYSGCKGDLGNPLVCNGRLTGVLSLSGDCTIGATSLEVNTRVSNYTTWINSVTAGASTFQPGIAVLVMFAIIQIITCKIIS